MKLLIAKKIWNYSLDKDQKIKYEEFKGHNCDFGYEGAIGGKYTVSFNETNLGHIATAKCACGKEVDLTDYSALITKYA